MKAEVYLKALEEEANHIEEYLTYNESSKEPVSEKKRMFWAGKLNDIKDKIQEVKHFIKEGEIEWK